MAFALPALVHIRDQPPVRGGEIVALVLAPTRELAQQSAKVCREAGAGCGVRWLFE